MRLAVRVLAGGVVLVALYLLWVFPRPARAPVGELAFAEIGSESSGAGHIAYYASGEGARVVLLASLGRSISDFNELAAALNADGWRTVAVESRAVGRSSYDREGAPYTLYDLAGDVEAALIADGAAPDEQVAVIGHAFGNRVARAFASQHPERVSRLVLVASGGSQRLARFVGKSKAMDMCLTGRMMDAEEAESCGMVSRVVPANDLMETALDAAGKIADFSQPSVALTKESVNRSYETTLAEGVRFERRLFHSLFATEDQKEGMQAFIEKRSPQFRNK